MNAVEELLGAPTGGPTANVPVTDDELDRLGASRTIVLGNFVTLKGSVDGTIAEDAWILVHESQETSAVARIVFQNLHNYLASLYSFNEQVRELVDEKVAGRGVGKRDFSPRLGDSPPCEYVERLAFLRGLRHSMQHGDYRSLSVQLVDIRNGFEFREVVFDRTRFTAGAINNPRSFTQYASAHSTAKPLPYVADFHEHYFLDFAQDCFDWLNGNP